MRVFIITIFCLHALAFFILFARLTTGVYPRTRKAETAGDAFASALMALLIMGWAAILLWVK